MVKGGAAVRFEDVVLHVVQLASDANAERDRIADEHPNEDPLERFQHPHPAQDLLQQYLNQLDDDDVFKLEALMYYGRGDDDLPELHEYLTGEAQFDKDGAVRQMMEKVPPPEYLETGLRSACKAGIDLESAGFRVASLMHRRSPS